MLKIEVLRKGSHWVSIYKLMQKCLLTTEQKINCVNSIDIERIVPVTHWGLNIRLLCERALLGEPCNLNKSQYNKKKPTLSEDLDLISPCCFIFQEPPSVTFQHFPTLLWEPVASATQLTWQHTVMMTPWEWNVVCLYLMLGMQTLQVSIGSYIYYLSLGAFAICLGMLANHTKINCLQLVFF